MAERKPVKKPRKRSVLTERQAIYVDAVMEGSSKSAAARATGGSANVDSLERSATVQEALKVARTELEEATLIRRVDVVNGLLEAIEMARTMAEPATMISGWKEMAKLMGYNAPETKRIELSVDQSNVQKKLEALDDKDLIEMLQARSMLIDVNTPGSETEDD